MGRTREMWERMKIENMHNPLEQLILEMEAQEKEQEYHEALNALETPENAPESDSDLRWERSKEEQEIIDAMHNNLNNFFI